MMLKRLRRGSAIFMLVFCIAFGGVSYTIEAQAENISSNQIEEISVRAEQVRWYFRKINGVKQKRAWSLTYGYWKTNWINC